MLSDITLFWVGFVGAVVGGFFAFLEFLALDWLRNQRKRVLLIVKVNKTGFMASPAGKPTDVLTFNVRNACNVSVTIGTFGFLPSGRGDEWFDIGSFFGDNQLPTLLDPGNSLQTTILVSDLLLKLQKQGHSQVAFEWGVARTAIGDYFKGKIPKNITTDIQEAFSRLPGKL
ncbi:MAG: hypothetical protein O2812_02275 [Chloroflexi bacterium]|nr:hypothetical protein [Chloroflexota bacterium]